MKNLKNPLKNNFLPKKIRIFLLIFIFISIGFGQNVFYYISAICIILFFLFYRQKKYLINYSKNCIVSPVSGRVKSVEHIAGEEIKGSKIILKTSILNNYSIVLPFEAKVKKLVKKNNNIESLFLDGKDINVKMHFKYKISFFRPRLVLEEGDYGMPGALIGFFPFGGTMEIYLKDKNDVNVATGDRVKFGKTFLIKQEAEAHDA